MITMHIKKCIRKKRRVTKAICGILKEKKNGWYSQKNRVPLALQWKRKTGKENIVDYFEVECWQWENNGVAFREAEVEAGRCISHFEKNEFYHRFWKCHFKEPTENSASSSQFCCINDCLTRSPCLSLMLP